MRKDSDRRGARRWICWRKIRSSNEYHTRQFGRDGSVVHYDLECGHVEVRKGSLGIHTGRLRCMTCQGQVRSHERAASESQARNRRR